MTTEPTLVSWRFRGWPPCVHRLSLLVAISTCALSPAVADSAQSPPQLLKVAAARVQDQEKITRWMWQANASIRRERLTSPAGSNAVYFYQKVLALDPDYQPAINGLADLPLAYLALAQKAYDLGNYPKVRRVLNRVVTVYGSSVIAAEREALEQQLARVAPYLAKPRQSVAAAAPKPTTALLPKLIKAVFQPSDKTPTVSLAKSALPTQPKSPIKPKSTATKLSRAPQKHPPSATKPRMAAPSSTEKRWMAQAQGFVEQRQFWRAETALKRALTRKGATDHTRLMLLDVLAKQAKWPQYQRVVLSLRSASAFTRSMLRAKMLLKIQQAHYAVAELANNPPTLAAYTDYYAVWALALQKSKRYKEAQQKYLALLQVAPHNPRHWLGLGIAYKGEGQIQKSCQAMNQVVQASVAGQVYLLDNRIHRYVRDHIERHCREKSL